MGEAVEGVVAVEVGAVGGVLLGEVAGGVVGITVLQEDGALGASELPLPRAWTWSRVRRWEGRSPDGG